MQLWLQTVLSAWEMPNFMQYLLLFFTRTSLRYFEELMLCKPWFCRDIFFNVAFKSAIAKKLRNGDRIWFHGPPDLSYI